MVVVGNTESFIETREQNWMPIHGADICQSERNCLNFGIVHKGQQTNGLGRPATRTHRVTYCIVTMTTEDDEHIVRRSILGNGTFGYQLDWNTGSLAWTMSGCHSDATPFRPLTSLHDFAFVQQGWGLTSRPSHISLIREEERDDAISMLLLVMVLP